MLKNSVIVLLVVAALIIVGLGGCQWTVVEDKDGDGAYVCTSSNTDEGGYDPRCDLLVVPSQSDCDDTDPTVGAPLPVYYDEDGDGYGAGEPYGLTCGNGAPAPTEDVSGGVTLAGDCDDNNPDISPGTEEVCDGLDNNCDGGVDEGVPTTYYQDADGDGYGTPAIWTEATGCYQPDGYVADDTDCDDADSGINPDAIEVCNDLDDNCWWGVDEGCKYLED